MVAKRAKRGKVELAVFRDLPKDRRRSWPATVALELARRLDRPGCEPCEACGCEGTEPISDRDAVTVMRELRTILAGFPKPVAKTKDRVDEIGAKRAARRGA
jgi:hypothetical protein